MSHCGKDRNQLSIIEKNMFDKIHSEDDLFKQIKVVVHTISL